MGSHEGASSTESRSGTIQVVIADDLMLMRQGLRAVLTTLDGIDVVAEAHDLPSLLAAVDETQPDVVITDVRMPPTNTIEGISGARTIRARHPGTGVIVLSQYAEPALILELFADGTRGLGYLLKERVGDRAQLRSAIDAVMAGSSSIDPAVVEIIVQERSTRSSPIDDLSDRERDVLGAIAEGLGNVAIAEKLALNVKSVEKHISAIFTKLQLVPDDGSNRRVRSVLLWLADS